MSDDMVRNLKKPSAWFRVLFMVGFVIALYVTGFILVVLMLAQILFSLLAGEDNINLRRLGAGLSSYVSQILAFLTYNSEQKPFPFMPFPMEHGHPDVAVDPTVHRRGVVDPVVQEPVFAEPRTVEPGTVEPGTVEPGKGEPETVELTPPVTTVSKASATFEEAQAVADDEGFQNPTSYTDTDTPIDPPISAVTDPTAPQKRSRRRKTPTIDPEVPHTDD